MITWTDFKSKIDEIPDRFNYMFRGQSDSEWILTTTLHRTNKGSPEYYSEILPKVKDNIETFTGRKFNLVDQVECASFLSFLQHHGFPTPLLDWTLSPYIAAYFAFADVKSEKVQSVKIFAFNYKKWNSTHSYSNNIKENPLFIVSPFSMGNKNQLIQQSIFMCAATHIREIISHIREWETAQNDTCLYEYELSIKERMSVMEDLKLMGITGTTLFPSIEGVCKGLKEEFFILGPEKRF